MLYHVVLSFNNFHILFFILFLTDIYTRIIFVYLINIRLLINLMNGFLHGSFTAINKNKRQNINVAKKFSQINPQESV